MTFLMKKLGITARFFVLLLLVAASGCASSYHDYKGCCVPLAYCPPPPLPYTGYCGCPTPIAKHYLSEPVESLPERAPSDNTSPRE